MNEPQNPLTPDPAPSAVPPEDRPNVTVLAPPPATTIVLEGGLTEREIELSRRLAAAEAGRRKAETEAAYAEDRARQAAAALAPPAAPKKKRWGLTFFHPLEDED